MSRGTKGYWRKGKDVQEANEMKSQYRDGGSERINNSKENVTFRDTCRGNAYA